MVHILRKRHQTILEYVEYAKTVRSEEKVSDTHLVDIKELVGCLKFDRTQISIQLFDQKCWELLQIDKPVSVLIKSIEIGFEDVDL